MNALVKADDQNDQDAANKAAEQERERLRCRLYALYERELDRQYKSRTERAIDADYYDGHQFSVEEKAIYENRGQSALVYNEIKPAILWLLGTERRNRNDWHVAPRSDDDNDMAVTKTKLLKYLDDINKARWHRSLAFADAVKTGEGWTEVAVKRDDKGRLMPILRYVHWREILSDSTSRSIDVNDDGKFQFRTRLIDLEEIKQFFPEFAARLEYEAEDKHELIDEDRAEYAHRTGNGTTRSSASGSLDISYVRYGNEQLAIRVIECWHKIPVSTEVLDGDGALSGEIYDAENPEHAQAVQFGEYDVVKTVIKRMHLSLFTKHTLLWHGLSPYKHNKFPYVRRLCETDDTTGEPVGFVRAIRDPQTDLNHRRNLALYLMSTRRVIMDKGAVEDIRVLEEEIARPDSIIQKTANSKLEIIENQGIAAQELQIANMNSAQIRQISGVTGENQGLPTNATSGIAIQARAEQGSVITTVVFDNAAMAHQLEGELMLSLVEQFMTRKMQFRITGDNKKPEFVTINDGRPETDITRTQADFIVGEKDWRISIRAGLSEQFMNLAQQLAGNPQLWLLAIEIALDLSDLPNRKELIEKFRKIIGGPNPDEDPEVTRQREEQQQQQQAQQQQMVEQEMLLKFANMKAQTSKAETEARRNQVDTARAEFDVLKNAMESAGLLQGNPDLATTVDDLMANIQNILSQSTEQPLPPTNQQPQPAIAAPAV